VTTTTSSLFFLYPTRSLSETTTRLLFLIYSCNMMSNSNPFPCSGQEQVEVVPLLAHCDSSTFHLDLSHLAQSTDEKLPSIIITPCVPSSPLDYEIAFLASKKEDYTIDEGNAWSFMQYPATRIINLTRKSSRRSRAAFCLALPVAIVGVHLLIDHIATNREGTGSVSWPSPFWS